jgi:predicted nucleic acid-binding protein
MYLVDTNVISESRKGIHANSGVQDFFRHAQRSRHSTYISVITIGELRKGVTRIESRGDDARPLQRWLNRILKNYSAYILDFSVEEAQVWGRLMASTDQNAIDKQIAATALCYDLTVVTRNTADFEGTTAKTLNPFH